MELPKYYEMHKPFLEYLKDGQLHTLKELKQYVSRYFNLTEESLSEMLPSGRQTVFVNRIGWARTYLKKAGLIDSPERAIFTITSDGLEVLNENLPVIDSNYLMRFESFREFQGVVSEKKTNWDTSINTNDTPDDTFEDSFRKINKSLADDLLVEVVKLSPIAFEQMVIDLLSKMGYGAFENAGKTTSITGDEGIDGIIMEDKLGFNLIYIQAKRWALSSSVGRPDVQSFVGAISGKGGKGLFVTTSKFSKQASEYANHQHVILIDGEKLAKLMIEHNFGVAVKKVFEIKAIDTDVFNEYLE
ncbi:restriction endonuclease [Clostridium algidicarnis]|uniref:restriction endonuclease n=1 Tax=Clostridium algidicarnis TaxID=37659 RepID=UPI001C0D2054|nr:restriction endonuclease [Clostridium algidicarnis]MBU3207723.1 restriction endonuclease [Clostridium algidicarnis]